MSLHKQQAMTVRQWSTYTLMVQNHLQNSNKVMRYLRTLDPRPADWESRYAQAAMLEATGFAELIGCRLYAVQHFATAANDDPLAGPPRAA